jgi:uncharacterized membrane protein YcaP (DUF421 family)
LISDPSRQFDGDPAPHVAVRALHLQEAATTEGLTLFSPEKSLLQIVIRVTLVYVFLMILLRFTGKKELGQLEPMDLLTMLILSETVSPALTAQDTSLTAAAVASGTLLALTVLVSHLTFRWRIMENFVQGKRAVLIRHGKVMEDVLRAERITDQQLSTALHQEGIEAVSQVKMAYVEPSGDITIIKKEQAQQA